MVELKQTREAYGKTLVELGKQRKDIVVLDADLSSSTCTGMFAKHYPERFFNIGIAEQNLIDIAAGLALSGKTPFVSSFAIFLTKAWEQIRNIIAHDNLNVKIVATHAGISVGRDGSSHQSIEDIALMRAIPNMKVIVPADAPETEQAVKSVAETSGPFYVRLSRADTPVVFHNDLDFEIGRAHILREGSDVTIITTGVILYEAVRAANILRRKGISTQLINMSTIKPIDKDAIIAAAAKTGAIITAEEHSFIGGLGDAVAEVLSEKKPALLKRIGIRDKFGQSGGFPRLWDEYGLTCYFMINAAEDLIKKKE
jgi:transketolase